MKKKYFIIIFISLISLKAFSQENAYSSFDASLRNSIKFNRFLLNPAFSFAREVSPTITVVNRRQWVKFENAPQLYFANYLGSINYNSRFGLGVYQQNVGLLKNFGGVINYAYNIPVGLESNLTFGINTYIYNSTFDFGKIITVETEPLLLNQEANSLIALKPGLNFGTEMFDFGVSVNNLVLYNLTTSEMVNDNQENSYLGYLMYTGYVNSYRGILEDAKFSSLISVEKNKDATALAGNLLLDIPNKAWVNAGYNTLYGFSAGVGITLSEKFSFGYTYDLGLADVSQLGASHEFLLSYRFEDYEESNRYYQSVSNKSTKKASSTPKKSKEQIAQEKADQLALAKAERERKAAEAAEKAKKNKEALEEAARKKQEAANAKKVPVQPKKAPVKNVTKSEKAKAEADAKAERDRLAAEKAKAEADAKAPKDKLAAEEAARKLAAEKAKAEADAKAERDRLAAEKAKAEADVKAQKDKLAAEEAARKLAEEKAKAEEEARKKLLNDESSKAVEAFKKDIDLKTKASDKLTQSLDSIVKARDLDLKEFLLENTLNSDGTARAPRKFVSTAEQNAQLQSLKSKISSNKAEFDKLIRDFETTNNQRIKDLKAKGVSDEDAKPLNDSYLKILNDLKQKRATFNKLEVEADLKIQKIKEEKEAERQRRIKKAEFDNEKERNLRDQQILENLKKNQNIDNTNVSVNEKELDGQAVSNTVTDIPIIKKLTDVEPAYYLVLATFSNIQETQAYLTTVVKSGGSNVNFFYNLHNSTYYVYIGKQDTMGAANQALKAKGTKTYNKNMFIVKVE